MGSPGRRILNLWARSSSGTSRLRTKTRAHRLLRRCRQRLLEELEDPAMGWDSRRGISGPGTVAGQLTGDPSSDVMSFYGETGYRLSAGGLGNITPFVGLGVAAATLDGFTEKDEDGTGAALRFDSDDASSTVSMLGMRLDSLLDMGSGVFTPELSVAWAHEFGDTYQTLDASFADGPPGTSFTVIGSEVARDSLVVGADINMALTAGLDLRLSYDGWFNGDYTSNAVTAKLGWSF